MNSWSMPPSSVNIDWLEEIEVGRLLLAQQPVVASEGVGKALYAECLARFMTDTGEVLRAERFYPSVLHQTDLRALDRAVLLQILNALEADPAAVLGCNICGNYLKDGTAWISIIDLMEERPAVLDRLILELSQTEPFEDLDMVAGMIDLIRKLGCRVALDDFGAGFASPTLLHLIDFDIVKIDGTFVQDLKQKREGQTSLGHLVGFASCFVPVVVVDGIETAEHSDTARSAGATHQQGFYHGMPELFPIGFPPIRPGVDA